jgi:hypothetical protein
MYRNYRLLMLCIAMVCKSMIACWPSGDIYYEDQPQSRGDIYYDDQPVSYQKIEPIHQLPVVVQIQEKEPEKIIAHNDLSTENK